MSASRWQEPGSAVQNMRPGPAWGRLPLIERRALASRMLEALRQLKAALPSCKPDTAAPVAELVAWVGVAQDIQIAMGLWRDVLNDLQGAGRSPAQKGQGWPALDVAGGTRHALRDLGADARKVAS